MGIQLFRRSARLFAQPSFLQGVASVIDLAATQDVYNENATGQEADSFAIYSDWASVGDHILEAARELSASGSK